jgi:hypothetical protein
MALEAAIKTAMCVPEALHLELAAPVRLVEALLLGLERMLHVVQDPARGTRLVGRILRDTLCHTLCHTLASTLAHGGRVAVKYAREVVWAAGVVAWVVALGVFLRPFCGP